MITYNVGATNDILTSALATAPTIGDSVDFTTGQTINGKDYAIGAVVTYSKNHYHDAIHGNIANERGH